MSREITITICRVIYAIIPQVASRTQIMILQLKICANLISISLSIINIKKKKKRKK